jgi:hypothetical protein
VRVESYSGRKADERPLRFRTGGHEYEVRDVLDQWYGPEDAYYKVRADDGNLYILQHEAAGPDDCWHIVSFQKSGQRL